MNGRRSRSFQATVSRNYPDHAVAMATLGYILTERGEYAEAEQLLTEALQIERTVFGEDNERVAQTEAHLGLLYDRQGDSTRAIEATRKRGQNREQAARAPVII